jgi:hypothetical protein
VVAIKREVYERRPGAATMAGVTGLDRSLLHGPRHDGVEHRARQAARERVLL